MHLVPFNEVLVPVQLTQEGVLRCLTPGSLAATTGITVA